MLVGSRTAPGPLRATLRRWGRDIIAGFGRAGPTYAVACLVVLSPLAAMDQLDHQVQSEIQEARSAALDRFAHVATDAGKTEVVLGGLLAIAVFTGPAGPATARAALFALAPANLAVEGLKRAVGRARPDGERRRSNASFPSSHAANATALAAVLAARWRRAAVLWWIAALLVAMARVILNRHFMSDVLVGAVIGVASAWMVLRRVPLGTSEKTSQPLDANRGDAAGAR